MNRIIQLSVQLWKSLRSNPVFVTVSSAAVGAIVSGLQDELASGKIDWTRAGINKLTGYALTDNAGVVASAEAGLKSASGRVRGLLGERIDVRHIPEIRFVYDNSIAANMRMDLRLEEIKKEREARKMPAAPEEESGGDAETAVTPAPATTFAVVTFCWWILL